MENDNQSSEIRQQHQLKAADQAMRANRIRAAYKRRDRFGVDDRERVARNLHDLMEELRTTHNLKKLEVVRQAGLGGNGATDSTKRLDTYTLPSDATQQRRNRLATKAGGYIKLVEAAAAEAGISPDDILCRAFEGCDYGTKAAPTIDWEDRRWPALTNLLRDMCSFVIRQTGVDAYWRDVQMRPGSYDARKDAFRWSPEALWPFLSDHGLAGSAIFSDETPPVPSVLIARACPRQPRRGTIAISGGPYEEIDFFHILEIRLAIGPVVSKIGVGPLLEFRTVLEAEHDKLGRMTFDKPFTDGSDVVKTATCANGEFPVNLAAGESPDPLFRNGCEHSYFAWMELSPSILLAILTGEAEGLAGYEIIGTDYNNPGLSFSEIGPSRFGWGDAAFQLHAAVTSGCLEEALITRSETLKGMLASYDEHVNTTVEQAETAARNRWRERQTPNEQVSSSEPLQEAK
jgi:hypothetical protein